VGWWVVIWFYEARTKRSERESVVWFWFYEPRTKRSERERGLVLVLRAANEAQRERAWFGFVAARRSRSVLVFDHLAPLAGEVDSSEAKNRVRGLLLQRQPLTRPDGHPLPGDRGEGVLITSPRLRGEVDSSEAKNRVRGLQEYKPLTRPDGHPLPGDRGEGSKGTLPDGA
jgi:hypothetical protein